jgi:hypothetical protein
MTAAAYGFNMFQQWKMSLTHLQQIVSLTQAAVTWSPRLNHMMMNDEHMGLSEHGVPQNPMASSCISIYVNHVLHPDGTFWLLLGIPHFETNP